MRTWKFRFTVRRLMLIIAVAAVTSALGTYYFSPFHRWRRAIHDDQNGLKRWEAINQVLNGEVTFDEATALVTLAEAARSESRRVRETAIMGIGRFGPAAIPLAPILIEALADPEPLLRAQAARVLAFVLAADEKEHKDAVAALRPLLNDRSRYVRENAAIALAEFGQASEALPILLDALREPDAVSSGHALWAIGRIGPRIATEALAHVKAMESRYASTSPPPPSPQRFLRVYTAHTRIQLGDRADGISTLQALAQNDDADLASEARRILRLENVDPSPTQSSEAPALTSTPMDEAEPQEHQSKIQ